MQHASDNPSPLCILLVRSKSQVMHMLKGEDCTRVWIPKHRDHVGHSKLCLLQCVPGSQISQLSYDLEDEARVIRMTNFSPLGLHKGAEPTLECLSLVFLLREKIDLWFGPTPVFLSVISCWTQFFTDSGINFFKPLFQLCIKHIVTNYVHYLISFLRKREKQVFFSLLRMIAIHYNSRHTNSKLISPQGGFPLSAPWVCGFLNCNMRRHFKSKVTLFPVVQVRNFESLFNLIGHTSSKV